MPEKLHVSWEDYGDDVDALVKIISKIKNPHLVTLYRGGLPLGTHLSNILDLPLSIVDFQSYDGDSKEPVLIKNAGISVDQTLVIVDDIYDVGTTMNRTKSMLWKMFPHIKLVGWTLYVNSYNSHLHEKYDQKCNSLHDSKGLWVEFPWEVV